MSIRKIVLTVTILFEIYVNSVSPAKVWFEEREIVVQKNSKHHILLQCHTDYCSPSPSCIFSWTANRHIKEKIPAGYPYELVDGNRSLLIKIPLKKIYSKTYTCSLKTKLGKVLGEADVLLKIQEAPVTASSGEDPTQTETNTIFAELRNPRNIAIYVVLAGFLTVFTLVWISVVHCYLKDVRKSAQKDNESVEKQIKRITKGMPPMPNIKEAFLKPVANHRPTHTDVESEIDGKSDSSEKSSEDSEDSESEESDGDTATDSSEEHFSGRQQIFKAKIEEMKKIEKLKEKYNPLLVKGKQRSSQNVPELKMSGKHAPSSRNEGQNASSKPVIDTGNALNNKNQSNSQTLQKRREPHNSDDQPNIKINLPKNDVQQKQKSDQTRSANPPSRRIRHQSMRNNASGQAVRTRTRTEQ